MDLLLTRKESGASNLGFSKKNSTSLRFLVKSLMYFSISGKLCYAVGVNLKPLLKIWICEEVKFTLDKFRTLEWIISFFFGWLSLLLKEKYKEKNDFLRNCSHLLRLGLEHLAYLVQLLYVHFVGHYYWSRFRHSFRFLPFQIFLPVFVCMVLFYQKMVTFFSFLLSKLHLVQAILFCYF